MKRRMGVIALLVPVLGIGSCADDETVGTGTGTGTGGGEGGAGGSGGGVPGQSCSGLPDTCGPSSSESCCASGLVPAGLYAMGRHDGADVSTSQDATDAYAGGHSDEVPQHDATISAFRLDTYEVTVGRFRNFVAAYPGSRPAVGAGKAANVVADTGWQSGWDASLAADQAALITSLKCNVSY